MKRGILFLSFILLFSVLVSSAGVSTSYWEGNPLKIFPGEEKVISLRLQNLAGKGGDWSVKATISKDVFNVASLLEGEKIYDLPFGTEEVRVPVMIKIPQEINEKEFEVWFSLDPANRGGGESTVQIAQAMTVKIPIEILDPLLEGRENLNKNLTWIIALILILIGLIIIIIASLTKKGKLFWKKILTKKTLVKKKSKIKKVLKKTSSKR